MTVTYQCSTWPGVGREEADVPRREAQRLWRRGDLLHRWLPALAAIRWLELQHLSKRIEYSPVQRLVGAVFTAKMRDVRTAARARCRPQSLYSSTCSSDVQ